MENNKPSYYAIIPADVRYDQTLPGDAKLLYGEITSLANKEGYCFASNAYFARVFGVEQRTVTRWVKALIKAGHVHSEVIKEKANQRRLYPLTRTLSRLQTKLSIGVQTKMSIPVDKNIGGAMDKNVGHNNTSNNNIFIIVTAETFVDYWY